ncbi:LLM class flavin-dependent oxidoreductase [[Eubacterium] cellulosolvens]
MNAVDPEKRRIGLTVPLELNAQESLDLTILADQKNFDSVWKTEDYYYRDGISLLSALAIKSQNIRIGTCVINPYTRNIALIAISAATIDEVSNGRFILGLGSSTKVWIEDQMGIKAGKPIATLRESVEAIREILKGELLTYEGKEVKLRNVQLGFQPYRRNIPVYLAAVGPKMLQLVGEIADGVILTGASSTCYIKEFALKNLEIGAKKRGRTLQDIEVCCNILFSLSKDSKKAKESTRFNVGLYLSPPEYGDLMMRESGLDPEILTPIRQCINEGEQDRIKKYVTDEMIDTFTISGNKGECENRFAEYKKAGLDLPIMTLTGNYREAIKILASFES